MARILVVDDDKLFSSVLCKMLESLGHSVDCAHTLRQGLDVLSLHHELVLLDVLLPDGSGLEALDKLLAHTQHPEIIVMTSNAEPAGASFAVGSGVWDYIEKGAYLDHMETSVTHALKRRRERLAAAAAPGSKPSWLVGSSMNFVSCLELAVKASVADANVLITGETGSGKELFARIIHDLSHKNSPFVTVDCAALPVNLAESILFGHVRGAFTGADREREGLIATANGGILFLDELGELPGVIQKSFLRVLQEQKYRRVGSTTEAKSKFRVLAATNRNLEELVTTGDFRQDLLYRLNAVTINIPPLRDRAGDVGLLANYFLGQHIEREGVEEKTLSSDFVEALSQHSWPGNVRELKNVIDAALINAGKSSMVYPADLPGYIRVENAKRRYEDAPSSRKSEINQENYNSEDLHVGEMLSWRDHKLATVTHSAKKYFGHLLMKAQGDFRLASRMAGMSLPNFYATLNKYKILAKFNGKMD